MSRRLVGAFAFYFALAVGAIGQAQFAEAESPETPVEATPEASFEDATEAQPEPSFEEPAPAVDAFAPVEGGAEATAAEDATVVAHNATAWKIVSVDVDAGTVTAEGQAMRAESRVREVTEEFEVDGELRTATKQVTYTVMVPMTITNGFPLANLRIGFADGAPIEEDDLVDTLQPETTVLISMGTELDPDLAAALGRDVIVLLQDPRLAAAPAVEAAPSPSPVEAVPPPSVEPAPGPPSYEEPGESQPTGSFEQSQPTAESELPPAATTISAMKVAGIDVDTGILSLEYHVGLCVPVTREVSEQVEVDGQVETVTKQITVADARSERRTAEYPLATLRIGLPDGTPLADDELQTMLQPETTVLFAVGTELAPELAALVSSDVIVVLQDPALAAASAPAPPTEAGVAELGGAEAPPEFAPAEGEPAPAIAPAEEPLPAAPAESISSFDEPAEPQPSDSFEEPVPVESQAPAAEEQQFAARGGGAYTVSSLDADAGTLVLQMPEYRYETRVKTVQEQIEADGEMKTLQKEVEYTVTVPTLVEKEFALAALRIVTPDGTPLDKDEVQERLQPGATVLYSQGTEIDPALAAILNPDTIVVLQDQNLAAQFAPAEGPAPPQQDLEGSGPLPTPQGESQFAEPAPMDTQEPQPEPESTFGIQDVIDLIRPKAEPSLEEPQAEDAFAPAEDDEMPQDRVAPAGATPIFAVVTEVLPFGVRAQINETSYIPESQTRTEKVLIEGEERQIEKAYTVNVPVVEPQNCTIYTGRGGAITAGGVPVDQPFARLEEGDVLVLSLGGELDPAYLEKLDPETLVLLQPIMHVDAAPDAAQEQPAATHAESHPSQAPQRRSDPEAARLASLRGVAALQSGEHDEALELIEEAAEHDAKAALPHYLKAYALHRAGEIEAAEEALERAQSLEHTPIQNWYPLMEPLQGPSRQWIEGARRQHLAAPLGAEPAATRPDGQET